MKRALDRPVRIPDVLYEFAIAADHPDARVLEKFVRAHPEMASELTDLAVDLAMVSAAADADDDDVAATPTLVEKAVSRMQNHLFKAEQLDAAASTDGGDPPNPFAGLDRPGARRLAEQLDVSLLFVAKLRDREIVPETIPTGFRNRVAGTLGVPPAHMVAHLSAPRTIETRSKMRKADDKPRLIDKQTFEDAVRGSGMTPDQQRKLLEKD